MTKNDLVPKGTRVQSPSRNRSGAIRKNSLNGRQVSRNAANTSDQPNQKTRERDPHNTFTTPAPPSTPSSPAPQGRNINDRSQRLSASDLEELLRRSGYDNIPNAHNLHILWSASHEPPITKDTLSELDLPKLYEGLFLRHDLNFDREIQFSPRSPHDSVGKQKQAKAQGYWDAVEIELAFYGSYIEGLRLNPKPGSSLDAHSPLPKPRSLNEVPQRLAGLIQEVCRIVKTLVPPTKWSVLGARLNPKLFIQELEHGQCDIENLFKWVGGLLLNSCAPSRDSRIDCMIQTISKGYRSQDSHTLRCGLEELFYILEIMKLDSATYQFQLLREFMLSLSVNDERQQLLLRIKTGWEVPNWLEDTTTTSTPSFSKFTTKFISLISHPIPFLPIALALDHTRIHKLQTDFQLLTFQAACSHALTTTLHFLGWIRPTPESSNTIIASLIFAIEQDLVLDLSEQREALVLGIANHAWKLCAKTGVPSPEVICVTEQVLQNLTETPSPVVNRIVASLSAQLAKLVDTELAAVKGMDALQLSTRYTSKPTSKILMTSPLAQQTSLEDVARKMAHIATLHWRVWAPILYLRRDCEEKESGAGDDMSGVPHL